MQSALISDKAILSRAMDDPQWMSRVVKNRRLGRPTVRFVKEHLLGGRHEGRKWGREGDAES
jgi:hypothetical protein